MEKEVAEPQQGRYDMAGECTHTHRELKLGEYFILYWERLNTLAPEIS